MIGLQSPARQEPNKASGPGPDTFAGTHRDISCGSVEWIQSAIHHTLAWNLFWEQDHKGAAGHSAVHDKRDWWQT